MKHSHLKPGYVGKLKNGMPYRCYAVDGGGDYKIHGAYWSYGMWLHCLHNTDGNSHQNYSSHDIDLPETPSCPQVAAEFIAAYSEL